MPDQLHLFIDFDDTLSDFKAHTALYASRLSANLAAEFGGEPAEWVGVLKPAILASIERYAQQFKSNPLAGFCAWVPAERALIATEVFESVGRKLPADIDPAELTLRIQTEALTACQGGGFYAHAREVLAELHEQGIRLHMASSHESRYLEAAMTGAGINHLFDSFYGADLIDCAKEGTEYYCRMFEACGIRPEQAIVLDDGLDCLRQAQEAGAHVIQARLREDPQPEEFPRVLTDWRNLPAIIEHL